MHEAGHYLLAKWAGVKVLRFSLGFGKPLWLKRFGEDQTEFVLAMVPLGGYVKMLDEREGDVTDAEKPRAFNRQSLTKRALIVLAGPVFNLLFAIICYCVIYNVGIEGLQPIIGPIAKDSPAEKSGLLEHDIILEVAGHQSPTWNVAVYTLLKQAVAGKEQIGLLVATNNAPRELNLDISVVSGRIKATGLLQDLGIRPFFPVFPALIGDVVAGGAAEKAGLLPGDLIKSVAGTNIADWNAWVKFIQKHPGKTVTVFLERNGQQMSVVLTPERVRRDNQEIGLIRAHRQVPDELMSEYQATLTYPMMRIPGAAVVETWEMSVLMLQIMGRMLTGTASIDNLSGPISIAKYAGQSAQMGWIRFIQFLALVSISLGVLNLLPIPLLDGGHLFFYLLEFIKRGPISEEFQLVGQRIGMVLLVFLMSIAFYKDIERLWG